MRHTSSSSIVAAGLILCGGALAHADTAADFSNPAFAMTNAAVLASGECIARYSVRLDDGNKPAAEVGQSVAKRCAAQLSKAAGLASWMIGKPEDFSKTLKYQTEDLTTNAVLRARAVRSTKF